MSTTEDSVRSGAEALRRGDARTARESFSRALQAGRVDAATLLGLAYACRALNDVQGEAAAVDRLLSVEPRNLRGLLMKGDRLVASGDKRTASSYYMAALKSVPGNQQLPADLAAELKRVRETCDAFAQEFQSYVVGQMRARGFDAASPADGRFAESLDIMLGRKRIYLQEPKYYFFPGLPTIQFYGREDFAWLEEVERATDDIRAELLEVLREPGSFAPYVQGDPNRPQKQQAGMLNNPAWSAFYLWKNGERVEENARRCPKTLAALAQAPLAHVASRSPSVLFSLLGPGARIPPHHGFVNTRLICHLPLIVPGRCMFRVGNDVRPWVEGKAWVFDDTIEHEACNESDQTRVILLFDIWRPELTDNERGLVAGLFEAIDAHGGTRHDWTM